MSLLDRFGHFLARKTKMVAVEREGKAVDQVKTSELIASLEKQVIKAEIWEIPVEDSINKDKISTAEHTGPSSTEHTGPSLTVERATLVTLEDGKTKYLIRRSPSEGDKEDCGGVNISVWYKSVIQPNWVQINEKEVVENEKLRDYLQQTDEQKKVCEVKQNSNSNSEFKSSSKDEKVEEFSTQESAKEKEEKMTEDKNLTSET